MEERIRESGRAAEGTRDSDRTGPILGLQLSLSSSPWRLGPGWALLAGALAAQTLTWDGESLLRLGGSLLLADALWGVLWQRTAPRSGVQGKRSPRASLPYYATESPLTGFVAGLRNGTGQGGESGWPGTLAALGLTALLSVLLGRPAIVLSVLALLSSLAASMTWKRGKKPAFFMALLGVALPWALGATLGWTGDLRTFPGVSGISLMLGAAFSVLAWSLHRVECADSGESLWLIWFAQGIVLVTMAVVRAPMALAITAGLFVVPCLWLSRHPDSPGEVAEALRYSDPWWLASMLTTALAVRF